MLSYRKCLRCEYLSFNTMTSILIIGLTFVRANVFDFVLIYAFDQVLCGVNNRK